MLVALAIRLVVAEDQYLVREGVRRLLETHPQLEVAAVCGDLGSRLALADAGHLAASIRSVAEGGSVIDPKVVETLVAAKARAESSPLDDLTPRERDVLREIAEGKNNAAIAGTLFLSERSVEKVIHAIFLKLGLTYETSVHKRVKATLLY